MRLNRGRKKSYRELLEDKWNQEDKIAKLKEQRKRDLAKQERKKHNRQRFQIFLAPKTKAKLQADADRHGMSMSSYIGFLIINARWRSKPAYNSIADVSSPDTDELGDFESEGA